jgi:hypothetical protein
MVYIRTLEPRLSKIQRHFKKTNELRLQFQMKMY